MNRNIIIVTIWPRNSFFQGKRVGDPSETGLIIPETIAIAPADAELMIAEYKRIPYRYEQETAASIEAALREWREDIAAEDDDRNRTPYIDHVEKRSTEPEKEEEPYE